MYVFGKFLVRSCQFTCLILVVLFLESYTHASEVEKPIDLIAKEAPMTIGDGIKEKRFSNAFRRVFAPYFGLSWVKTPVLEEPRKIMNLGEDRQVLVFFACRPHACSSEKLCFVFDPKSGDGWGAIRIQSDVEGSAPLSDIEKIVNTVLEQ